MGPKGADSIAYGIAVRCKYLPENWRAREWSDTKLNTARHGEAMLMKEEPAKGRQRLAYAVGCVG